MTRNYLQIIAGDNSTTGRGISAVSGGGGRDHGGGGGGGGRDLQKGECW